MVQAINQPFLTQAKEVYGLPFSLMLEFCNMCEHSVLTIAAIKRNAFSADKK